MSQDEPKNINLNIQQGPNPSAESKNINLNIQQGPNPNPESKNINLNIQQESTTSPGPQKVQTINLDNIIMKGPGPDSKKMAPPPKPISYEFNCKNNVFFEAPRNVNAIYYSVLILFIMFLTWAYFSQIDEITRGDGKVIPSSHVKTIQSLDGGIISKFYIKDGDLVKEGQLLIKLDDTRFSSDYNQNYVQLMTLIAEMARLKAQVNGTSQIDFPKDLENYPDLKVGQTKLFKTMTDSLKKESESLEKDLHLAEQELHITMPLIEQGLLSQLEKIRLEKQVSEAKSKLIDITENFKTKANSELAEKQNIKVALEEKLKGLEDRIKHTEITSPVEGYINNFKLNTVGGVIKPGMDILDVVPVEEQVIIESRINPRDRGFIKTDQPATIKFPAYDSSIYGGLDATVISISPDTSRDEKNNEYYLIRLMTNQNYVGDNKKLKIIPGMTANVNILTGRKRILFYLLRPVTKIKEFALKER